MSEPTETSPSSKPKAHDPRHLASVVVQRVGRTPLLVGGTVLLLALWTGAFLLSTSNRSRSAKAPAPPASPDQTAPGTRELLERFLAEAKRQEAEEAAARADRYPSAHFDDPAGFAPPDSFGGPPEAEVVPVERREAPRAARFRDEPADRDPRKDRLERALEASPLVAISRPGSGGSRLDDSPIDLLSTGPAAVRRVLPESIELASGPPTGEGMASEPRLRPVGSLSPRSLAAGSLIPAVLTSGANSDAPGVVTAVVSHDVFDTLTGRSLLIPAGSRLLGRSGGAAHGQSRLEILWSRLTLPDGSFYALDSMPASDPAGTMGLEDRVNRHLARTFGSALLLSAFTAAAQLSQPDSYGGDLRGPSAQEVAAGALGQQVNSTASALIDRELRVPPTLVVRPGTACNVIVTADLVFEETFGR